MTTFDEQVDLLKEAFTTITNWSRRKEIANVLGIRELNIGHRTILQMLVRDGYIEERQVPTSAPSKYRFEYRLVNKK